MAPTSPRQHAWIAPSNRASIVSSQLFAATQSFAVVARMYGRMDGQIGCSHGSDARMDARMETLA